MRQNEVSAELNDINRSNKFINMPIQLLMDSRQAMSQIVQHSGYIESNKNAESNKNDIEAMTSIGTLHHSRVNQLPRKLDSWDSSSQPNDYLPIRT